jgi:transposase
MMSTTAPTPAPTPLPVQLSEPAFEAFIFPHRSMPKRGPKCQLGYHRVFNLILWVLYTGMPWKGLPIPQDAPGKPAIPYTTIDKVLATWTDDGSLWQACVARVRHRAAEKQLDLTVLHGDGTNTVANKGAIGVAPRATNTRKARRSSRSSITLATSSRLAL